MSSGSKPSNSRVLNRFRKFKTRFETSTTLFWYIKSWENKGGSNCRPDPKIFRAFGAIMIIQGLCYFYQLSTTITSD